MERARRVLSTFAKALRVSYLVRHGMTLEQAKEAVGVSLPPGEGKEQDAAKCLQPEGEQITEGGPERKG
jgi:hypothetical protein